MKRGLHEFVNEEYQNLQDAAERITNKSTTGHMAEDVVHETLEYFDKKYDEEWLFSMYQRGELKYFFINAIQRQITSSKTAAYTRYRKFMKGCDEPMGDTADNLGTKSHEDEDEQFLNFLERKLKEVMEHKLTTLQLVIFKKYLYFNSQVTLANAAKLSPMRISHILKEVAYKLNNEIKHYYPDYNCKGKLRSLQPIFRNVMG